MKGTELQGLEVDRVDAVDKPATKRKFLILKAEDGKDPVKKEAPTQVPEPAGDKPPIYESMAKALLDTFNGVELESQPQADALMNLAKGMSYPAAFSVTVKTAKKEGPMPTADDGKKKPGDTSSELPGMMKTAVMEGVEPLAKAITALSDQIAKSEVKKSADPDKKAPASTQGKDDNGDKKPVVKKAGEGLFTSVIFPETATK